MKLVQKRLLNLVGLMVLGAGAGLLLFWQVDQKKTEKKTQDEKERVLPERVPADVRKLRLETPNGALVVVRNEDGAEPAWQITSPIQTAAEDTAVEGVLGHLSRLKQLQEVGEKSLNGTVTPPKEVWLFGLEPPRFTVELGYTDGTRQTLLVGKKNSFDGAIYVQRAGQARVLQVDGSLEYQVDKRLYDLRDKRALVFDPASVQKIRVAFSHELSGYTIERRGAAVFRISEPRPLPADPTLVDAILSALANVRAEAFLTERAEPADREQYGLNEPSAHVSLSLQDAPNEPLILLLRKLTVGNSTTYYVMRDGPYPILQVGSDWLWRKIRLTVDELRDKQLVHFEQPAVAKMEVQRGADHLVFAKYHDSEIDRDQWKMVSPAQGKADAATLTGLLYRLSTLKARAILVEAATPELLDQHGLSEPEVRVRLADDQDQTLAAVRFGPATDQGRAATNQDEALVFLVDGDTADEFSSKPEDYQEVKPVTGE